MLNRTLASLAALGLAMAPIAAQAGTRAGDAGVSLDRMGASVAGAEAFANDDEDGVPLGLLLGGAILVVVLLIILGDADEDNASPGAN